MTRKLRQALEETNKKTVKKTQEISGLLGLKIGGAEVVNIPSRIGYVYVRLRDNLSEIVQARNDKVSTQYDLPVLVVRSGNGWEISGRDMERYAEWGTISSYLPIHGSTHEFDKENGAGIDVAFIYPDQIIPALIEPYGVSGSMQLYVQPYNLQKSSGDFVGVGDIVTSDLSGYCPTDNTAIMGLVYLNQDDGQIQIIFNTGTPFSAAIVSTVGVLPYIPPMPSGNNFPLKGIRLTSGTATIGWDNLYDVRQWLGVTGWRATGTTSVNPDGMVVWNEGVFLGTGSVLNFVGDNVDATLSGTVITVFITGSTSSADPPITGSVVISDDNSILGSVPVLNFGNNLSATISGSVAQIDVTNIPAPINTDGMVVWNEGIPLGTGSVLNFVGDNVDVSISGSVATVMITGTVGGFVSDTPNRVVITNGTGTVTTDDQLTYNTTSHELVFGKPVLAHSENSFQILKDGGAPGFAQWAFSSGTSQVGGLPFFIGFRANGSYASPTAILNNMGLARFSGRGYNGSTWSNTVGQLLIRADGDWSPTSTPTKLEFYTTTSGTLNETLALAIEENGSTIHYKPDVAYTNTKANIEAIVSPIFGMRAITSDTKEQGFFNGSTWVWGVEGSGGLPDSCHVANSTQYIIPNGVLYHPIFDTTIYASGGMYAGGSGYIYITKPGLYQVSAYALFINDSGTGTRFIIIKKNGTNTSAMGESPATPYPYSTSVNAHYEGMCVAGDYFTIDLFHDSGGSDLNASADLMVAHITGGGGAAGGGDDFLVTQVFS